MPVAPPASRHRLARHMLGRTSTRISRPARHHRSSPVGGADRTRIHGPRAGRRSAVSREGLLARRIDVVPHARVQSLRLSQGPWQRMLGLADLHVDSPPGPVNVRMRHRYAARPGSGSRRRSTSAGPPEGRRSDRPARRLRRVVGRGAERVADVRGPETTHQKSPRPPCGGELGRLAGLGERADVAVGFAGGEVQVGAGARRRRAPRSASRWRQHAPPHAGSDGVDRNVGGDVARAVREHVDLAAVAVGPQRAERRPVRRACARSRRPPRCRGAPGARRRPRRRRGCVPTSARVPGSPASSGHHASTHAASSVAPTELESGVPQGLLAGRRVDVHDTRGRPSSSTSTTWHGMLSSHSFATTSPSTDSGSAGGPVDRRGQAAGGRRPRRRAGSRRGRAGAAPSAARRGRRRCPRPCPGRLGAASSTTAAANSGRGMHRRAEVGGRRLAAEEPVGAVQRRVPGVLPGRGGVGGGIAGMPSEVVLVMPARLRAA